MLKKATLKVAGALSATRSRPAPSAAIDRTPSVNARARTLLPRDMDSLRRDNSDVDEGRGFPRRTSEGQARCHGVPITDLAIAEGISQFCARPRPYRPLRSWES